ncbi:hypothetical protein NIES3804_42370 [Microcystis aeruginosa NIES-3804]|uniref:Uncharacterized protein n=1 Tax=Microcystis aeruginosa NIES-3804 TaxID=2517783 RepID=A0A6H9G4Q7_MICAE|nr:hypothetical protein NIES3804_42370 [Microcystis aeruginosa NIES-3804]
MRFGNRRPFYGGEDVKKTLENPRKSWQEVHLAIWLKKSLLSNETVTYSLEAVLREIKDSIKEVSQKVDSLEKKIVERFDKVDEGFDKIVDRLTKLEIGQVKLTEKVEGMDKRVRC